MSFGKLSCIHCSEESKSEDSKQCWKTWEIIKFPKSVLRNNLLFVQRKFALKMPPQLEDSSPGMRQSQSLQNQNKKKNTKVSIWGQETGIFLQFSVVRLLKNYRILILILRIKSNLSYLPLGDNDKFPLGLTSSTQCLLWLLHNLKSWWL